MALDAPRAILAGFAVVVALALFVAGSTSGVAFGTYNPAWDGTADFRSLADQTDTEQEIAQNVGDYRTTDANGTLAVVLSPESAYDESESAAVRQFVRSGGTLLVAEDLGPNGNRLLRDVGARVRFDSATLRDERNYEAGPALPVATPVEEHNYTSGVETLVLNHGTAIRADEGNTSVAAVNTTNATVLVESSSYAYLDRNRNKALDDDETLARSPIVTVEPVGDGQVIAVSDPSLFINTMLERGDNRQFARSLYNHHDQVILDISQGGGIPPLQALLLALRKSILLQLAVGTSILALVAGWPVLLVSATALSDRLGRSRQSPRLSDRDTVIRGVKERHPEWDPERVERVTQAIMGRQTEDDTDD